MRYEFKSTDYEGNTLTVGVTEESLPELMQHFRRFLLGVGFSANNVSEYIEPN